MRIVAAAIAAVVLTVVVSGCGTAGQPGGAAATPGTAAAPSGRPPAGGPVWIDDLQMFSAAAGWALAWTANPNGNATLQAARTADGGQTWTYVTPAELRSLPQGQAVLLAADADRAWLAVAARQSTVVYGSTDAGRSWRASASVPGSDPSAIDFADPQHGWLLENLGQAMGQEQARLYRTSDGGAHWTLAAATDNLPAQAGVGTIPAACDKSGLAFSSSTAGWITAGGCNVLADTVVRSTDGGVHWRTPSLPVPAGVCQLSGCTVPAPEFAGGSTFLQIDRFPASASLLVSSDGGASWRREDLPAGAGAYPRLRFFSPTAGIAVAAGSQGMIGPDVYLTSDGGRTWTAVRQGHDFGQEGVEFDFVTPAAGFAWTPFADAPAMLARTSDSGRTWTLFTPRVG